MRKQYLHLLWPVAILLIVGLARLPLGAQEDAIKEVMKEEAKRVAAVDKVRPSVVAVFGQTSKGGGSGVIINPEGYALTNFHVVKPSGNFMKCGLADGELYDAVLVSWDMVGDVALIKLLPPEGKKDFKFPYSVMGDSDKVKEGDWSLAMGNPFLLATDFTPTVTFGMVSGVHRYQYPSGTILEYTDCIQIDTSINPGNSGGPLFNMNGELIGINGRGSFDKRGRVNSGVGYAISINQIKNFLGHLKAGLNTDHATLGAAVTTQTEKDGFGRMVFTSILEESDVARRGLQYEDELISFDGRPITSVNHFKNVMGLYPRGWRLPMVYRRNSGLNEILVRLMGVIPKEAGGGEEEKKKQPEPIIKGPGPVNSPAAKFYEAKPGFVNFYFNKLEKKRVFDNFKKQSDFSKLGGDWTLFGDIQLKQLTTKTPLKVEIKKEKGANGNVSESVKMTLGQIPFKVAPLDDTVTLEELQQPGTSGGLLVALYLYQRMMTLGEQGFASKCNHAGNFPYYPPMLDGKNPTKWHDSKTIAEVIETRFGKYEAKWYFSLDDQKLVAFEVWLDGDTNASDPCEVYLSDYRPVQGQQLAHKMQVRHADGTYGTVIINNAQFAATK